MMARTNHPLHVVFVLPSLLLGGGIEKHLTKMLRHFDRTRFSLSLVTLFEYKGRPDIFGEVPSDVRVIRLATQGIAHPATWISVYRVFKELQPDVVVGSMFSPNALIRILKPFFGYSVVTREHNTYDEKRWYHCFFDHILSYMSDALVAVSSDVADFASRQAWIPRKKFTVINNGVDIQAITQFLASGTGDIERARSLVGLHEESKVILNVARLKPTKDHSLLLRAFSLFSKEHPEYHLVIVGDGSERAHIEAEIEERGLKEKAHLLGYRTDVFAWFGLADIFVLSSKREGFPNVGVEAMAFGLPFITTPVAGVSDLVQEGKNGFIVPATPEAVQHALVCVAEQSEEERNAMREVCRKTAERFDIQSVVRTYEALFESLQNN